MYEAKQNKNGKALFFFFVLIDLFVTVKKDFPNEDSFVLSFKKTSSFKFI